MHARTHTHTHIFKKHTVKSHFKALGLYNFRRGFEWANKREMGSLYAGGLISGIKKMFWNDEVKRRSEKRIRANIPLDFETYNTFIVRHNKRKTCFKNIYKTDLCDCLKRNAKGTQLFSRWACRRGGRGAYIRVGLYPE